MCLVFVTIAQKRNNQQKKRMSFGNKDYRKYFRSSKQDNDRAAEKLERRDWKSTMLYVRGTDIPKRELDFETFPCCGGKGRKWVKKAAFSHRMTLVKCTECESGKAKATQ